MENTFVIKEEDSFAVNGNKLIGYSFRGRLQLDSLAVLQNIDLFIHNVDADLLCGQITVAVGDDSGDHGDDDDETDKADNACVKIHFLITEELFKLAVSLLGNVLGFFADLRESGLDLSAESCEEALDLGKDLACGDLLCGLCLGIRRNHALGNRLTANGTKFCAAFEISITMRTLHFNVSLKKLIMNFVLGCQSDHIG